MSNIEIAVGRLDELGDPGCREFQIGEGDWPLYGFVVRQGDSVYAYQNTCVHVGHPLNWMPDAFLTKGAAKLDPANRTMNDLLDQSKPLCSMAVPAVQ